MIFLCILNFKKAFFKFVCVIFVVDYFFFYISGMDCIKPNKKDETPMWYYFIAGIVFSLAMVCTTYALVFVTFPTQVVFKSAKPIAVMLINLFVCKRYTIQRYFFVSLIVVGLVLFNVFGEQKKDKDIDPMVQYKGIAILSFSLLMDGTLGAIEDRVRHIFAPTSNQMMVSICGWSSVALIVTACATEEVIDVYNFATKHPAIIWHLSVLGIAGAVGQLFIFTMVTSFGALPCSVTTTVRKFFSVVFSIIFMGNPSTAIQWVGTVVVFMALLADATWGKKQIFGKKNDVETANEHPREIKATTSKSNGMQYTGQNAV